MENRLVLSVQVSQDQQNNSVLYPEIVSLLCLFFVVFFIYTIFVLYICPKSPRAHRGGLRKPLYTDIN